jgi:aryl-alcohol dehydrogenase-like predicted oxidoreductase
VNKLPNRSLGQSTLKVSPLGLGCWQFSKGNGFVGKFWPILNDTEIHEIVKISIEGGINWFDTAEVYGWGQSEKALANALKSLGELTDEILIATKWWPLFRSSQSLIKTIDNRISALQDLPIDLYQIHQPYSFSSIHSQMKAMAKLLRDGKIRYAGVSNFSAKQMREAYVVLKDYGFHLVSNQVKYSMLDRRIEKNGVLDSAKELGISIIAYSPLEQGILTGKFHRNPKLIQASKGPRKYQSKFKAGGLKLSNPVIQLLEELAVKHNASAGQVALNWLINYSGDSVVAIPGASKVSHAEENIKALTFQLSNDDLAQLSDVSRNF